MGDPIPTPLPRTEEPVPSATSQVREASRVMGMVHRCPGCDCMLSDYEVFACRIRGLKKPVCIGCMAKGLVFVRDELLPLLERLQEAVADLAEKVPAGR